MSWEENGTIAFVVMCVCLYNNDNIEIFQLIDCEGFVFLLFGLFEILFIQLVTIDTIAVDSLSSSLFLFSIKAKKELGVCLRLFCF